MRQLFIQTERGDGPQVVQMAQAAEAVNIALLNTASPGVVRDVVIAHVPNGAVGRLIDQLETLENCAVTLVPHAVITLKPGQPDVTEHATRVQRLSPLEVFLGGLQSVGSWGGFLAYAVAAGIVVWIGLFTNSAFLLIAAMLLAPFAGPAMNAALASARGDAQLLGRSLLRYFISILLTIVVSFVSSLVLGQNVITEQMAATGSISEVALLLPLIAGAAGALNLVQSERSSLVSGTATGVLVAAALAPPAGLVGMTAAMGRWDLASDGLFLLLLQLVGINLSGALAFRFFGVNMRNAVYERGRRWLFPAAVVASAAGVMLLLAVQFSKPPYLQRSSIQQHAVAAIQDALDTRSDVYLAEARVTFTRPNIPGQDTLIAHLTLQRKAEAASAEVLRAELTPFLQQTLIAQQWNITPLVDIIILDPPATL
jgi:uncharacterized hydrophobic protein (TIGR00341 family)